MASYKNRKQEERQFWREFIGLYRRLPELWNAKSFAYMDRNKRETSYQTLIDKMRQFDPRADKASVVNKINSLRSTYRRELAKVKAARATGKEYVPTLFYFNDMYFLRDHENPGISISALRQACRDGTGEEAEFVEENNETEADEDSSQASQNVSSWQHTYSKPQTITESSPEGGEESKRAKLLSLACKRLTNPPSESELLVKSWLVDYEKLSPDQQLYAKKFINDILFEGQLGNLHRNAITVNSAPQSFGNSQRALWAQAQDYSPGPSNANPPDPSPHSNIFVHCDSSRVSRQAEQTQNSTVGSLPDLLKEEQFD